MFKSAISSLTNLVVGATKETIKQYLPSNVTDVNSARKMAMNSIIQNGIAKIAYRSPILSDIAQSVFNAHKLETLKKEKILEYVNSNRADWLRPKVKESLGSSTPDKKINDEMMKIISKISKEIERVGVDETKKSGKFQEYEKYFDEFTSKQQTDNAQPHNKKSLEDEILNRIESNTRQTVNALEVLSTSKSISPNQQNGNGEQPTKINPTFIDPLTGLPSIKHGMGSIGGSLLHKIFDDDMLEKFSKKIKKLFDFDDSVEPTTKEPVKKPQPTKSVDAYETNTNSTPSVPDYIKPENESFEQPLEPTTKEPVKKPQPTKSVKSRGLSKSVETMFAKDIFDLNSSSAYVPDYIKPENENTSESSKELNKERSDIAKKQQETQEQILDELKHLNKTTEKKVEENKDTKEKDTTKSIGKNLISKGKDLLKNTISGTLKKILPSGVSKLATRVLSGQGGRVLEKIGGRVLGGVGNSIKGVAGRVIPSMLSTVGAAGTTSSTISTVAGGLASRGLAAAAMAAAPALLVGGAGALGYGVGKLLNPLINSGMEKMTGNSSLGSWVYDKTHKDVDTQINTNQNKLVDSISNRAKESVTPKPVNASPNSNQKIIGLNKVTETKKNQEEKNNNKKDVTNPIIINNNSVGGNSGNGEKTNFSVRNMESTFEKVQMQGFWKRTS